ncbi:MAG: hypothetical protein P8N76_12920 [Pirellulaceae bacterium]|nr:hypothetical protein [Pirellulaceae bacterium]
MSPSTVDSDFWGHVKYGQDTLKHGIAETATYTFTAQGHRWINHEHLSEIIFASGSNLLGVESLLLLKCLLGCIVLLLIVYRALKQQVNSVIIALVCLIVSINLSFYWGLRPHLFSFFYFALLIAWTDCCFQGWTNRWNLPWPAPTEQPNRLRYTNRLAGLWLCPFLLWIWANTHGGFLAGLAVYLVILGSRAIEYGFRGEELRVSVIAYLGSLMIVGGLATILNPYGTELHRWLFEALRVPRPEILEWHPPDLFTPAAVKLWVLLALITLGLIFSRLPRDFTQLLVLALVLSQGIQHQRHLPFVVLLFGFWLPPHLQSVGERLRMSLTGQSASPQNTFSTPTRTTICLLLMLICTFLAVQLGRRLQKVEVAREQFPVSAIQFMANEGLTGKLVVSGRWAQYTISVLGARKPSDSGIKVAFDGRFRTCYPQEAVDRHFDFFVGNGDFQKRYRSPQSPPADPTQILRWQEPDLVLLNRRQQHSVAVMQQVHSEWVLLYQDELAQLWGRASEFDEIQSTRFLPKSRRHISSDTQTGVVPWPAAPRLQLSFELAQNRK